MLLQICKSLTELPAQDMIMVGYYFFMFLLLLVTFLSLPVGSGDIAISMASIHQSIHPGRCPVHSEVSFSVEFDSMRFMSVYSVIVGLNLLCGVNKMMLWGYKKIKERSKG